tara:strand:- start:1332 stop:1475 length:144 start_codon:yes stop_codon:yes gene_type:complete
MVSLLLPFPNTKAVVVVIINYYWVIKNPLIIFNKGIPSEVYFISIII